MKFIKSIIQLLVSTIFLFNCKTGFSQNTVTKTDEKKIDELFQEWTSPGSPGAVVALVRNDSVLFQKGYGLSNIEYNISNTPQTSYYICSLAKQFTAYSILLLAKKNKLQLDDDIHLFLPWMYDFGKKITIKNLLHHTSGIRDDLDLLKISGLGRDGIITQDLALNILKRQHTLSFPPGEQFVYSNSNFILLAEIVKAASGQSFRQFTDSAIFKPLHMLNSHFYDNALEIIANRAVSYTQTDSDHFQNSFQNVYTLGDGGLFMPMEDMTRWIMNLFENKIGDAKDIRMLNENGKLNNGKEVSNTNTHIKGWNVYQYNGGLNGYKTFITIFPDLKTGFIVFANNGDDNTYSLFNPLSDLFIPENKSPGEAVTTSLPIHSETMIMDSNYLKRFSGDYMADNNSSMHLYLDSARLFVRPGEFLLQKSKDTFFYSTDHSIIFVFAIDKKTRDTTVNINLPSQTIQLTKYDFNKKYTDHELMAYNGSYYCSELDCRYQILVKDHGLLLISSKYPESPIIILNGNNLKNDAILGHFTIIRNREKAIIGFEVQSAGLMNLRFIKSP